MIFIFEYVFIYEQVVPLIKAYFKDCSSAFKILFYV